ncbi:MAG: hypothetical protein WCF30_02510 [Terracidiphilus sp.]
MMSSYIRRIHKLGPLMGDVLVSACGCFALMRGFRLVTKERNESDTAASDRAAGTPREQLAGIGAALFLLAFVASEAAAAVIALRH